MKPDTLESPISPAAKETEAAEPQSHTATAAPAWTQEQLRAHVDYLMAKVHQSRETGTQDHREQAQGMRDRPQSLEDQRQGFWDERQGIEDRLRLLEAKSRSLQGLVDLVQENKCHASLPVHTASPDMASSHSEDMVPSTEDMIATLFRIDKAIKEDCPALQRARETRPGLDIDELFNSTTASRLAKMIGIDIYFDIDSDSGAPAEPQVPVT